MVSLHEQVAAVAFAPPPIPLFEVPPLSQPADRKAFRALMVGGRAHTHGDLAADLRTDFGVQLIPQHWHTDRARLPTDIPVGTEIMLIVTTVISHELSNHARGLAQKAKLPYIGINTKRTSWPAAFGRYGLTKNPAWAVVEPLPLGLVETPIDRGPVDPFGLTLATARKAAGLSQRALGERIDTEYPTISNWENGKSTPRFAVYRLLLEALPALRSVPPPLALEDRVRESLTPTPAQIAAVAPEPPSLPLIAMLGIKYAEAIADAERHKRLADDQMRMAEASMDAHKSANERAESLRRDIFEHAMKG